MHCKVYKLHQHSMYTLHILLSFIKQLKVLVIDWDLSPGTRSTMSLVTKATAAANETCRHLHRWQCWKKSMSHTPSAPTGMLADSNAYLHTLNVN